MRNRKLIPSILLLVIIGAGRLQQTLSRPRMETVRGVDIVSLTGSGFCFGIAFALLVLTLRGRIGPPDGRAPRS
jgi:hypothetical protein